MIIEPVEPRCPDLPVAADPFGGGVQLLWFQPAGPGLGGAGAGNKACSRTLRCLEIACWVMVKGSVSWLTVASPPASRARIARLVGSASAAKVELSRSSVTVTGLRIPRCGRRLPR